MRMTLQTLLNLSVQKIEKKRTCNVEL